MRSNKTLYILPAVLLLLIGTGLGMKLESSFSSDDTYEHLRKLQDAFLIINRQYVEEVKPDNLAQHAIEGMLKELDPHSTYISADRVADMKDSYEGSFGGVGIIFQVVEDTVRVMSTISGGPSEEEGVMGGDRIIGIDDSSAIGITNDQVRNRLKGEIGSKVKMTVDRQGRKSNIDFVITRGEIPMHTIESSYMLDDETGYIRLSRFAMTTPGEFDKALQELKGKGMERLVFDLRSNPGGVMDAAVKVADEMLEGGQTIVYTKGREEKFDARHRSTSGGDFEEQPVILLVNEQSASASEIVAGALQDHDRALIVGRRTFGKGLVQKPFSLSDGSVLQMTVSRYYTPVGRLIQTPYEDGSKEDYYESKVTSLNNTAYDVSNYIDNVPDSLKYKTDMGRTVFGGGGILPDYFVPHDSTQAPLVEAARGGHLRRFAVRWFLSNGHELREHWGGRQEAFINNFEVNEDMLQSFFEYAQTEDLGDFKLTENPDEVSVEEGVFPKADVDENFSFFSTYLKAFIARRLYGATAWFPIYNKVDPVFEETSTLWNRASRLAHADAANTQGGTSTSENNQ